MFRSIVNDVLLYQAAAIRLVGFDGFCNARTSAAELAHIHVDSPAGAGLTYDGMLVWSPATAYPFVPYTPRQLPCVAVSIFTNDALAGTVTGATRLTVVLAELLL